MTVFFWSDPHFGHANILEFEPNRRNFLKCESIDEHDEELVKRYNSVVKKSDTCYILGDLALGIKRERLKELVGRLQGTKILIKGNHDSFSNGAYLNAGFIAVLSGALVSIGKTKFLLSHFPYKEPWYKRVFRRPFRHLSRRPINNGQWLLCGHIHSVKHTIYGKQIHVGVDSWNGYPVSDNIILGLTNDNIR